MSLARMHGDDRDAARATGRDEPRASPSVLLLPLAERVRLEQWARRDYPREACGLLVGRRIADRVEVVRAELARNDAREPGRFGLNPGDFVAVDAHARATGHELVGMWHSHPDHAAIPSELDRAAAWSGWSYVIVEMRGRTVGTVRSWRLVHDAFVEELISTSPTHRQRAPASERQSPT